MSELRDQVRLERNLRRLRREARWDMVDEILRVVGLLTLLLVMIFAVGKLLGLAVTVLR